MTIQEQIVAASTANSWGGKIEGNYQDIWNQIRALETQGIANRIGFNLTYRVTIGESIYTVSETEKEWSVSPKIRKVLPPTPKIESPPVVKARAESPFTEAELVAKHGWAEVLDAQADLTREDWDI